MKLTRDRIIDAGMATFAEVGYQGLSMRRVADRLQVQVGSLYYHVRNKQALLQQMADRITREAYDSATAALTALPADADWQARIEAQATTLRHTLRTHPGGATLLADSPKTLTPGALALMERLLRTLTDADVPAEHSAVAADAILSYTTGFVLQEQSTSPTLQPTPDEYTALLTQFPLLLAQRRYYPQDEVFLRSIRLLCSGIAATIPAVKAV